MPQLTKHATPWFGTSFTTSGQEMERANTGAEKNKMGIFYSLQASKIKSRGNVMDTLLDLWEVVDSIIGRFIFM